MTHKILHPGKLLLYVVLSLLDLCLTYRLLQLGGGQIYESNPIANAWLNKYGWLGLTAFKVVSMIVVAGAAVVVSLRHPRAGGGILTFACSALVVVVLYSCSLINAWGKGLAPGASLMAEFADPEMQEQIALRQDHDDVFVARWLPNRNAAGQADASKGRLVPPGLRKAWVAARMRRMMPRPPGLGLQGWNQPPAAISQKDSLPREIEPAE